ncbi:MAG: hypothetical protein ACREUP_07295 [Burkholderiales bacterium]
MPIVQGPVEALVFVTPTNLADGFGRQADVGSHIGSGSSLVQLREGEGAEDDSNRLDPAAEHTVEFGSVAFG